MSKKLQALLAAGDKNIEDRKETVNKEVSEIERLTLTKIIDVTNIVVSPYQPRTSFDEEDLASLQASMEAEGLMQPITVRELRDGTYELIEGERRVRCARAIGWDKIRAFVLTGVDDSKAQIGALLINKARASISDWDTAKAIRRLLDAKICANSAEAFRRVGIGESQGWKLMKMLTFTPAMAQLMDENPSLIGYNAAQHLAKMIQEDRVDDAVTALQAIKDGRIGQGELSADFDISALKKQELAAEPGRIRRKRKIAVRRRYERMDVQYSMGEGEFVLRVKAKSGLTQENLKEILDRFESQLEKEGGPVA
jgi:ParB/RepB/Spo0J family partition protein